MAESTYKKIYTMALPYWQKAGVAILCGLIVSALTGGIAWLVRPALDLVFVDKRYEYFTLIPVAVVFMFSAKGFFHFWQQYLMKSSGLALIRDTRNKMHNHILHMPPRFFDKESSGMLMSRVISDVTLLEAIFSEIIRAAIIEVPKVFILIGIALYQQWDVTIISIAIVPVLAYSTRKLGKKVKNRSLEAQNQLSYLTQMIGESITGIKVIKVFNRQKYRSEKFVDQNKGVFRQNTRAIRSKEMAKLVTDVLTGVALGMLLFYGGYKVMGGTLTVGAFASVITSIYLAFSPIKQIGESYTSLQRVKAAILRIEHVLNTEVEVPEPIEKGSLSIEARNIDNFEDGIIFDNVSFSYPAIPEPIIKDVSLNIKTKEVLALVGPSGAGKTTFVSLIPRFYDVTKGSIKIDGVDVRQCELYSLRNLIGIVSQDIVLFNDTVRENIAFGKPDADLESIKEAAVLAYADEFIDKLPNGYDSVIGERGLNISGGQRQRIAIARAILKNPPILILDEATSSLDSVSESLVQKALEKLMKNRTTIVIAHRLSTIKNAHRIVVMEDGKIADIGSHDELIESNETYMQLYNMYAMKK